MLLRPDAPGLRSRAIFSLTAFEFPFTPDESAGDDVSESGDDDFRANGFQETMKLFVVCGLLLSKVVTMLVVDRSMYEYVHAEADSPALESRHLAVLRREEGPLY